MARCYQLATDGDRNAGREFRSECDRYGLSRLAARREDVRVRRRPVARQTVATLGPSFVSAIGPFVIRFAGHASMSSAAADALAGWRLLVRVVRQYL